MARDEVYSRLTSVFCKVFDLEALELDPALTADDVDGWDSLNHVRLMVSVQREFGVKFSAAEVRGLKNVGELVALIQQKAA